MAHRSVSFTEYKLDTGAIFNTGSYSSTRKMETRPGLGVVYEKSDPDLHFVEDGKIKERQNFDIDITRIDNVITLKGIPERTKIMVFGDTYKMVDDDSFEIEFDLPVDVVFTLTHPHYLRKVFTVES